jgi:hypothetical protein
MKINFLVLLDKRRTQTSQVAPSSELKHYVIEEFVLVSYKEE